MAKLSEMKSDPDFGWKPLTFSPTKSKLLDPLSRSCLQVLTDEDTAKKIKKNKKEYLGVNIDEIQVRTLSQSRVGHFQSQMVQGWNFYTETMRQNIR